jgi:integrase
MHTLRHTAAMRLLHAGVDVTVIALWLGHEQTAKITPQDAVAGRYQPPDPVPAFLAGL